MTLAAFVELTPAIYGFVHGATGKSPVKLFSTVVVVQPDIRQLSRRNRTVSKPLRVLLEQHGYGDLDPDSIRFKEGTLEEGEMIAVYGLCIREPDPEPSARNGHGYRDQRMRLRVIRPPDGLMLVSDGPFPELEKDPH